MAHLLRYSEWQGADNYWHCNDVEDLRHGSGYWWHPARMLGLTPAAYLKKVIDEFQPDEVHHSDDCSYVGWKWKSQTQMRKFKNWINAEARKHQFYL